MSRYCFFCTICMIMVISIPSLALISKPYPLVLKQKACMDKASSMLDMDRCIQQAYKDWSNEMSTLYEKLEKSLSSSQKAALEKSQLAWVAFQEQELQFLRDFYNQQGTLWPILYGKRKVDIIKDRVKTLYYDVHAFEQEGSPVLYTFDNE